MPKNPERVPHLTFLADAHYAKVYGWNGTNPYGTEEDFARTFQSEVGCTPFAARYYARQLWLLRELERADTLAELKSVIRGMITRPVKKEPQS